MLIAIVLMHQQLRLAVCFSHLSEVLSRFLYRRSLIQKLVTFTKFQTWL